MFNDKVAIFDTTLRDGEQSAGIGLTTAEKLEIARQLDALGVDIIEAGFAASSPGDFEAVTKIAKEVRRPVIASLARCHPDDIDAARDAVRHAESPRIHVFISSSDVQIWHQLRRNPEEVLDMAVSSVERARRYCDNVEFSPMDATRTDRDYLYKILEAAINAGASTVNIPDTVGYSIPSEFGDLIRSVRENVPNIDKAVISVHCHNDLGNAAPNSIAAVVNGARQVEGCINGLGERAGNASLEEVIMTIETRKELIGVATNIDTTQIYKTSRLVSDITGFPVQPNKAIVGANAFRHASGIHQDGVIKERSTFEIMRPESVGWPSSSLVLGKLSGRAGLRARLEQLGYTLDAEQLDKAFAAFKELADRKREVTDADLEALMGQQSREDRHAYVLSSLQIVCGSDGVERRADVTLTATDAEEDRYDGVGEAGNGPVSVTVGAINDALRHATGREVGDQVKFVHYEVGAITESVYALANVSVRVTYHGREFTGRGASADVMEASGKAYLDACNKALFTG